MLKAIADELARLEAMRAETMKLLTVAEVADEVAKTLPEMDLNVSVTRWQFRPPFINLRSKDVDSFKDVVPVLRELAARGWHTDKDKPFSDYHELGRRTYHLIQKDSPVNRHWDGESDCLLRLMVFLKSEGATCRKVQVGTKEEPVYEFQCD